MCVTHLHGVYCDGVFLYLLVMAWEVEAALRKIKMGKKLEKINTE